MSVPRRSADRNAENEKRTPAQKKMQNAQTGNIQGAQSRRRVSNGFERCWCGDLCLAVLVADGANATLRETGLGVRRCGQSTAAR